ncbi:hypothetical protein DBR00_02435 [Pseudomonas sp. HMWF032]|uniref:phage tail fiber domain-containing protein n=1 Tax=Pseudomonas sp. HMWF032 TaxID=2056866 RepID=UPI000D39AE4E|nr:phage tail fiber protein [Pseudomonas sp. HMWF032]PTS86432.1 hypothetical protein DBR00_02435 [Pseudomonas sp. HMWF032]PTT81379.1 hypothetical protein DBR41_17095 [Pseudomonas sp. HMWF010]
MADNARTVQVIIVETPTDKFDIPFDYLSKQFVKLFIDAVPQEPLVDFDFITATRIQMLTGNVPVGAVVELRRRTDSSIRLVTFKDASVLTASDLDISALQTLHMAEEAQDAALDAVSINQDGVYDARLKRIVNVGDPVGPQDAMNLRSANTLGASILGTASAKAQEAVQAAGVAVGAKDQAVNAAAQASAASGVAVTKATEATEAALTANTAAGEVSSNLNEYRAIRNELSAGPAGGMLPVGKPDWCPMRGAIWAGFAALDGQELPHATYPDFVAALSAGNLPTTSETLWQSDPTQRGKFVLNSSPGKFRLADYNGKYPGSMGAVFRRGDGATGR